MNDRSEILNEVMTETHTTQSELSRVSGVHQPSISQFLSGRVGMSDEMLTRLLSCMGYELEVVRRPKPVQLDRSHQSSWRLHRQLSTHLSSTSLQHWRPVVSRNLTRLRRTVRGQPHRRNVERWQTLVEGSDIPGLRRVMNGLDSDSIEMREVSPLGGLLSQDERTRVLMGDRP